MLLISLIEPLLFRLGGPGLLSLLLLLLLRVIIHIKARVLVLLVPLSPLLFEDVSGRDRVKVIQKHLPVGIPSPIVFFVSFVLSIHVLENKRNII